MLDVSFRKTSYHKFPFSLEGTNNTKTKNILTRTMSTFYSLRLNRARRRPLSALTSVLFLVANGSTAHAFAPSSTQGRNFNGVPDTISQTMVTNGIRRGHPQILRRNKTSLSALSVLQLASQASSMVPKSLFLMKDLSSPLSSVLVTDPDAEAQVLMDISHIFLDFTAFFKIKDRFLNYAQLIGRLAFIMIDFLPGHAFHMEEMAIQLFFLGLNIQKIMPYFDDENQETSSSTSISPDEIELQQELHDCPLLLEPIKTQAYTTTNVMMRKKSQRTLGKKSNSKWPKNTRRRNE